MEKEGIGNSWAGGGGSRYSDDKQAPRSSPSDYEQSSFICSISGEVATEQINTVLCSWCGLLSCLMKKGSPALNTQIRIGMKIQTLKIPFTSNVPAGSSVMKIPAIFQILKDLLQNPSVKVILLM